MKKVEWEQEVFEKIQRKLFKVAQRNQDKIPYTAINGVFDDTSKSSICWWTNGFWGGMMWQMYHATGEEIYGTIAKEVERKLDENLMIFWGMDHDSGFKWLPTAVANYRLTGNPQSKNRAILAACNLAGRFNPVGEFIRAWNDDDGKKAGWAIIDCMMNLPLLYWAYEETKDPRFLQIAQLHANTTAKYFVRADGSVNHIVEFDPYTGEFVRTYGGQGYAEGSSWTRGQAWGIYGFTLSYIHTNNSTYLEIARKIADYFITSIPESGFLPVDFRQPKDCGLEDSTAAAIGACGLLELAHQLPQTDGTTYRNAAIQLLKKLDANRCNWEDNCDYLLEKCTAAFHDEKHEYPIIYGDYFFIEAILKLTGEEFFLW